LQGPVSRHLNGSRALLASTSLSTSSNGAGAAVAGAAPRTKQIKTSSKETGTKTEYSVRVELNSGAVWAVGGLIVFGAGACVLAPQVARLRQDGVIGCIALVIGALGIYKGDMNKLDDKIDKVQEKMEGNFKEVFKLLQPLSDDLLVRNALKKK
jgi:hypothetical protein